MLDVKSYPEQKPKSFLHVAAEGQTGLRDRQVDRQTVFMELCSV